MRFNFLLNTADGRLTLAVDASVVPAFSRTSRPPVQKVLVSLNVGISPIDDALAVARFISAIFPSIHEGLTTFSSVRPSDWVSDESEFEGQEEKQEQRNVPHICDL